MHSLDLCEHAFATLHGYQRHDCTFGWKYYGQASGEQRLGQKRVLFVVEFNQMKGTPYQSEEAFGGRDAEREYIEFDDLSSELDIASYKEVLLTGSQDVDES